MEGNTRLASSLFTGRPKSWTRELARGCHVSGGLGEQASKHGAGKAEDLGGASTAQRGGAGSHLRGVGGADGAAGGGEEERRVSLGVVEGVLAKVERREMRQLFQRSAGERNPSRYANARPSARAGGAMAATVGVSPWCSGRDACSVIAARAPACRGRVPRQCMEVLTV